jgi:hypothetical protein
LSACTYLKDKNKYIKTYNSTPILEPYVKFFTKNEIYKLKKGKSLDIHRNLECRNFYILHKGKISITCIHPKYAEHFKTITPDTNNFIEKNENMIHMDLTEKQVVFVPNYWYVYIKAEDKHTLIEKVQYSTIMNQVNILCSNII